MSTWNSRHQRRIGFIAFIREAIPQDKIASFCISTICQLATSETAKTKARREYDALHRLQLHPWAPRILDSYQDAPGYAGEMFFFTLVDPAAPSIEERALDTSWEATARLAFARNTVRALKELHEAGAGHEPMVHGTLLPRRSWSSMITRPF